MDAGSGVWCSPWGGGIDEQVEVWLGLIVAVVVGDALGTGKGGDGGGMKGVAASSGELHGHVDVHSALPLTDLGIVGVEGAGNAGDSRGRSLSSLGDRLRRDTETGDSIVRDGGRDRLETAPLPAKISVTRSVCLLAPSGNSTLQAPVV